MHLLYIMSMHSLRRLFNPRIPTKSPGIGDSRYHIFHCCEKALSRLERTHVASHPEPYAERIRGEAREEIAEVKQALRQFEEDWATPVDPPRYHHDGQFIRRESETGSFQSYVTSLKISVTATGYWI